MNKKVEVRGQVKGNINMNATQEIMAKLDKVKNVEIKGYNLGKFGKYIFKLWDEFELKLSCDGSVNDTLKDIFTKAIEKAELITDTMIHLDKNGFKLSDDEYPILNLLLIITETSRPKLRQ